MLASKILRVALEENEATDETQEQTDAPAEQPTPEAPATETPPAAEPAEETPVNTETSAETPEAPATADATETPAPSTEEAEEEPEQKKLKREDELVFYAKIANFEELKKCKSVEYQEQYEVKIPQTGKNAVGGRIRVRKTMKGDKEPRYVLTTKTKLPDGSEYESDCKTTEENFIQFKYFCEGGMVKDRYSFPVEGHKGLKWEVDVFTGTNGLLQEWCKIDLERGESEIELTALPPFPIELTDVITNQNGQRTEAEETIVRTLYDTVFRTPNPIISKK